MAQIATRLFIGIVLILFSSLSISAEMVNDIRNQLAGSPIEDDAIEFLDNQLGKAAESISTMARKQ